MNEIIRRPKWPTEAEMKQDVLDDTRAALQLAELLEQLDAGPPHERLDNVGRQDVVLQVATEDDFRAMVSASRRHPLFLARRPISSSARPNVQVKREVGSLISRSSWSKQRTRIVAISGER